MMIRYLAAMCGASMMFGDAEAGPVQLSAFTSQRTEVSLAGLPFGPSVPFLTADGITFRSGAGSLHAQPSFPPFPGGPAVQVCEALGCILSGFDLDSISVDLPTPVARVGALLGVPNEASTATAEFYSGALLLGTVDISAQPFEGVFAGWDAGANIITSVKFVDTVEQGFVLGLSRFTYERAAEVSEPSTMMLSLLGLGVACTLALFGAPRRAAWAPRQPV